jgi:hypothetical protein
MYTLFQASNYFAKLVAIYLPRRKRLLCVLQAVLEWLLQMPTRQLGHVINTSSVHISQKLMSHSLPNC